LFAHESLQSFPTFFSAPTPVWMGMEANKTCELISKEKTSLIKLLSTHQSEQKTFGGETLQSTINFNFSSLLPCSSQEN